MNEKDLQHIVMRSIGETFRNRAYMRVCHPDMYEGPGRPDLIGHIIGIHVEIELKVYPNRPSSHQKVEIREVNRTGGFACIILEMKGKFHLVCEDECQNFSYREAANWFVLPSYEFQNRTYLNLKGLGDLLMVRKRSGT